VSPRRHRLSQQAFDALASGSGGGAAIQELIGAEFSKHMLLLIGVVRAAKHAGHEQYPLARAGFELLASALRENPAAAERVILHPPVALWARRTVMALRLGPADSGAEPARMAAVGAAAAIRAGIPAQIEIPAAGGRAVLPSLGAAPGLGPLVRVRTGPGQALVGRVRVPADPHQDAPGWLPLRRIRTAGLDVIVDDLDPFRMPERTDLAPRLAAIKPWEDALAGAWKVLMAGHLTAVAEIGAALRVVVPLAQPGSAVVSDSSQEAFGSVAMSLPPDPVNGAETLVHETQHLKLDGLLDLADLTLPDDGRRFYAPWRDDPRPVSGLLQGAYAYLGVTAFWRQQRLSPDGGGDGHVKYARWRDSVADSTDTLRSTGQLTEAGLDFVDGMVQVLGAWRQEAVPSWAAERAMLLARSHRIRWEGAHGPVPDGRPEVR
jgi:uncharacterized protein